MEHMSFKKGGGGEKWQRINCELAVLLGFLEFIVVPEINLWIIASLGSQGPSYKNKKKILPLNMS